jgi:four helix bundle protein
MKNKSLLKRFTKFGIFSVSIYREIHKHKDVPEALQLQFIRAATSVGANFAESHRSG